MSSQRRAASVTGMTGCRTFDYRDEVSGVELTTFSDDSDNGVVITQSSVNATQIDSVTLTRPQIAEIYDRMCNEG